MIEILLSLGALNALIPLLVIIILIGAAGMSTRNFSFFNLFGIDTLFGFTGGQGRSSMGGKSLTGHTMGPKSVFAKQKHASSSKRLKEAYFPFQIKVGDKIIQEKGSTIQYLQDRKTFVKSAENNMHAGKSTSISIDYDAIREWKSEYKTWEKKGKPGPAPSMPKSELELLKERHPDHTAVENEIGEKAANLRKVGLVISPDEGLRGMGIRPRGKLKPNRPYVVKKVEDKYLADVAARKGKGVAKKENAYASIAMASLLWKRQEHMDARQSAFDKLSSLTKQKLDELDSKLKNSHISNKDYNEQRKQIIRRFNSQSAYFYDTAHRGMTLGETLTSGKALFAGIGHSIKGDEAQAGRHFEKANNMFARGLIYRGGNTFEKSNDDAAQYKVPSESAHQYMGSGKVVTNEEELNSYKVRKKKKEDEEKEKAEKRANEEGKKA